MKVQKIKRFYPQECTCVNCCQTQVDIRRARIARKRRSLKVAVLNRGHIKPWPDYKVRNYNRQRGTFKFYYANKRRKFASRVRRLYMLPKWVRMQSLRRFRQLV